MMWAFPKVPYVVIWRANIKVELLSYMEFNFFSKPLWMEDSNDYIDDFHIHLAKTKVTFKPTSEANTI